MQPSSIAYFGESSSRPKSENQQKECCETETCFKYFKWHIACCGPVSCIACRTAGCVGEDNRKQINDAINNIGCCDSEMGYGYVAMHIMCCGPLSCKACSDVDCMGPRNQEQINKAINTKECCDSIMGYLCCCLLKCVTCCFSTNNIIGVGGSTNISGERRISWDGVRSNYEIRSNYDSGGGVERSEDTGPMPGWYNDPVTNGFAEAYWR